MTRAAAPAEGEPVYFVVNRRAGVEVGAIVYERLRSSKSQRR